MKRRTSNKLIRAMASDGMIPSAAAEELIRLGCTAKKAWPVATLSQAREISIAEAFALVTGAETTAPAENHRSSIRKAVPAATHEHHRGCCTSCGQYSPRSIATEMFRVEAILDLCVDRGIEIREASKFLKSKMSLTQVRAALAATREQGSNNVVYPPGFQYTAADIAAGYEPKRIDSVLVDARIKR